MTLLAQIYARPRPNESLTFLLAGQACHALGLALAATAASNGKKTMVIRGCGISAMLLHLVGQFTSMVNTGCFYCGQDFKPQYPGAFKTVRCLFITLWVFFLGVEACLLAGLVVNAFDVTVGTGLLGAGAGLSALTFFTARYYMICYAVGIGNLKQNEIPELKA